MKITSNNEDMLRSACEQFADKKVGDIQDIARLTSLSNITWDCKGYQLVTQQSDLSHYGNSAHKSNALLGIAQIRWLTHLFACDLELDGSI